MTWRARSQELRALLRLGAPICLAQTFQIGMQVVDTVMAGRYSPVDLAGIALASSIIMPIQVLIVGMLHAVTPVVAQLHGAGRHDAVGGVVRQGLWLASAVSAAMMLIIGNVGGVFGLFDVAPEVARVATGYMNAVLWGYPALGVFLVLRMSCEGMGVTRPSMVIAGVLLLANVPLNYAFIYGKLGAPALGGIGCGVATAIIRWLQCAAIAFVITRPTLARTRIREGDWRPDPAELWRLVRIGIPIGLKIFGVVSLFALATLLIARFGENAVSASAIAGNVTTVIFMIPMGLGMAATIRVGHGVGAHEYGQARVAGETAVHLAIAYAGLVALALVFFGKEISGVYTQSRSLGELTASLLLIVAVYQFADCAQEAAMGALRGYKDTRVPMLYGLTGYWLIGLPAALALGCGWLVPTFAGVRGFWMGFAVGETFVALTANVRRMRLSADGDRIARIGDERGSA